MHDYYVEYTDTFCGEANYSWVHRHSVTVPELTHYGYDGRTNYGKASFSFDRELLRRAKALVGLTGCRGRTYRHGDSIEFRPANMCRVLFITYLVHHI